jgi:hypothetical protein
VSEMAEISRDELRQIRIELAVKTCMSFPNLAREIIENKPFYVKPSEMVAFRVLKDLLKLEPSIKHLLKFYVKREAR